MSNFFNNIDARDEVNEIVDSNKIKVLYIRSNSKTRCKCYDPLHKDGDSTCSMCGGEGVLSSIESVETFCNPMSMDDALRMSGQSKTNIGEANIYTQTFYFKHKNKPNVGDRILVVGYDKMGLPTEVIESCYVSFVRAVRGFNGRIELYKAMCRTAPQTMQKEQKRLNKIPNQDKLKLMKGVVYQWGN